MEFTRQKLRQFVLSQAADRPLALQVLNQLRGYYINHASVTYDLPPCQPEDQAFAAAALSLVTEREVTSLVKVKAPAVNAAHAVLGESLKPLAQHLLAFRDDLNSRLAPAVREDLLVLSSLALGDGLAHALAASHARFFADLDSEIANCTAYAPTLAIFYLLAYTILGDVGRVRQLTPLVDLCLTAVPIGENLAEPGQWYLMVG